jgi:hypothetical protein
MGGTLSSTSLIISAALAVERLGRTRRKRGESRHGCSSFARREETIRDAEDSVLDSVPPSIGLAAFVNLLFPLGPMVS